MEYNLKSSNSKLKHVNFNLSQNQTKIMHVYTFAMRDSRSGFFWMQMSADNYRFQKRIKETIAVF